MKILNARINWRLGWANMPDLELLVDRIPDLSEMRFQRKGRLWFAEMGGYVDFFGWRGPENEGGYGGRRFDIVMEDGSEATLLGPWSSSLGSMNKAGFTPCMGAALTDDPSSWNRGYTFCAGAITVEMAKQVIGEFALNAQLFKCIGPYQSNDILYILGGCGQLNPEIQDIYSISEQLL